PDRCAWRPSAPWSADAAAPARRVPDRASAARSSDQGSASVGLHVVDEGGGAHAADDTVARRLPVEGRLDALRPGNFDARPRQVDGMHGEGEALARWQAVGELQLAGLAIDRLADQRLIGKAPLDPARQRGDGRVRSIDAAVAPDGLD